MAPPELAAEVYTRPDGAPYVRNDDDRHGEDAPDRRMRGERDVCMWGPDPVLLAKTHVPFTVE